MKINGLDLFSGIGGIALALAPWMETKGYCEIEPYCQKLLTQHMGDGLLDTAPIYTDVTKLRGKDIGDTIDIISGGFPCQDISVAGHGAGLA
jgi:DNA (cytosine-5)-methyltransferase 1